MSMRQVVGAALMLLVTTGCDSGPSGPGTLFARAAGEDLGAVLLEVEGVGIRGFVGRGGTQVYHSAHPDRNDVYRVILVDEQGGELGVEIEVDDRGMEGPLITVLQAARTDNQAVSGALAMVTVER